MISPDFNKGYIESPFTYTAPSHLGMLGILIFPNIF